jgi:hypothetical protein
MWINVARCITLGALAAILPAPANDTAATLGAGGLVPVKSSAIVMDPEDLQISYRGKNSEDRPVLSERRIDYILTTANNWAGPIHNFSLSVVAASPNDVVQTCLAGLTRVSPTRYELVRPDFRPTSDLHLLLLQAAGH